MPHDPESSVPKPARKVLQAELSRARVALEDGHAGIGAAAATNTDVQRPTMRGFEITDVLRMATYNDESALAGILAAGDHFPTDDARACAPS